MDTERKTTTTTDFVQRRVPWLVAAGALLVYLLTLAHGVTYTGLPVLARAAGWDWQPMFLAPLLAVLTYPVRWLPAGMQVIALNVFSAVCSALALALLARSVALLPQDRTREQRAVERSEYSFLSIRAAWVPPVFAALACGLQLSFWENSIVETGESLDLLLFAYCVRCLLEYRVEQRESWLYRMALVYGLAITNNYAMIAFGPLFLVALIWTRGRPFFRTGFLLRMLGLGMAGLLLYVLLPALNVIFHLTDYDFLEVLRTHWSTQRNTLWEFPRFLLVITGFTSLLPVLFFAIRWPAQYGDISAAGNALANMMMHVVHAVFLGACLWVVFDPTFSPRALGLRYGQPWAFLPLYYLAALSVGYCSGYFLLVLGAAPIKPWQRPSLLQKVSKKAAVVLVWVAFVAGPAALAYRNATAIGAARAPHLEQFGEAAARSLPAEGAVVLSDDAHRLYALKSAMHRAGTIGRYVLVDTTMLSKPAYHRFLQRQYPGRWPSLLHPMAPLRELSSGALIEFLAGLREAQPVFYLHPSFGYYFEFFYLRPRGLVYALERMPTNQIAPPLLTPAEFAANDQCWTSLRPQLAPLVEDLSEADPEQRKFPAQAAFIAGCYYSRALNHLGVEYQKAGNLAKAAEYFSAALTYHTNSPSAFVNQLYNRQLQAGNRHTVMPNKTFEERFDSYRRNIDVVLNFNGPIDEPQICFSMSQIFGSGRNVRQAVQQLQRAATLDPAYYDARVALANAYARINLPDAALQEVASIRAFPALQASVSTNPVPLMLAEALAYAAQQKLPQSLQLLRTAQQQFPQQTAPFATETQIHLAMGKLTNALEVLARQLAVQTNNVAALIEYGALQTRSQGSRSALPYYTRALELAPNHPTALLQRANTYLKLEQYDAALQDFQTLLATASSPPNAVFLGLGEVFAKKKNADKALQYFRQYLKRTPEGMAEIPAVKERIQKLKRGVF